MILTSTCDDERLFLSSEVNWLCISPFISLLEVVVKSDIDLSVQVYVVLPKSNTSIGIVQAGMVQLAGQESL